MGKTRRKARIEWKKRTRHERTEVAVRQIWETVDGRFRVVRSRSLYGLPTVWYAMRRAGDLRPEAVGNQRRGTRSVPPACGLQPPACSWVIISKHTKQATAKAAVERAAAQ